MSNTPADGADSDVEAMRRLAAGDDLALNEIMERWTPRLAAYLMRYLGDNNDVADLVQETFVAVYGARVRYVARAKFSTYLFGIASNLAKQRLRWRSRHPHAIVEQNIENDPASESHGTCAVTPASDAMAKERSAAVRSAILALPPDLREALVLSEFEDLNHVESAQILRCSAKAVETRVYRARKLLRKTLAEFLDQ